MTPSSGGSNPSATAGRPSVARFTSRSCTGVSTTGMPSSMPKSMAVTSPVLQESR